MGMVLKCSSSRITHLILPERKKKRSTSNEKRGVAAVRVAERGDAVTTAKEKRQRLFIAKSKGTE